MEPTALISRAFRKAQLRQQFLRHLAETGFANAEAGEDGGDQAITRLNNLITLWLFNIAMENGPFIDDFPMKTTIYGWFSMAMLNNQMVQYNYNYHIQCIDMYWHY